MDKVTALTFIVLGIAQLVLLGFKAFGVIGWSWWLVLVPLWVVVVIFAIAWFATRVAGRGGL